MHEKNHRRERVPAPGAAAAAPGARPARRGRRRPLLVQVIRHVDVEQLPVARAVREGGVEDDPVGAAVAGVGGWGAGDREGSVLGGLGLGGCDGGGCRVAGEHGWGG